MDLNILYEDNHVIVVYKPAGVLSQKDITGDPDMLTLVKDYIKDKYQKPGDVYLGLVHRLDRMTSGLMVFARTSKAASRLSENIKEHNFTKDYLAVVCGTINDTNEHKLVNRLEKNEAENKSYISENGKEAILTYKALKVVDDKTLIEVHLETGRHHQIRCQMANIGYPLYGDTKYGAKKEAPLGLQAFRLEFDHPTRHELMSFEFINYDGIFKLFK